MSTSFVEYRGRGFWSVDEYLEDALALLADRIGASPNEEWMANLRDHWRMQSLGDFRGWIHPNLDEFITTDKRRETVLSLLADVSSQQTAGPEVAETMTLFQLLLRGEMKTDASSPLDYMVGASPQRST